MLKRSGRAAAAISTCVVVGGLGLLAYMGLYNRYWADDWCYNRDFRFLGLAGTLRGYFFSGSDALRGYSTNRYALTLLSGLLYEMGILGTQILAALIMAAWFIGLLWVLKNLTKIYGEVPAIVVWLATALLLFYVLYTSPQRFQILYWRSGVHYSFTIIAGLYMLGLVTRQIADGPASRAVGYSIIPIAFFGGGLSEIGAAYLVSAFALFWAAAWQAKRRQAAWAERSYGVLSMGLIGLLVAILVLVLSPSNSRAAQLHTESTSWPMVPILSFKFSFDFISNSLLSLPLPHLVFGASFLFISVLVGLLGRPSGIRISIRSGALCVFGIAALVLVLIAAIQAPNVRFYSAPPAPRAQSLARFTMLAGIAVAAWIAGRVIAQRWTRDWINLFAVLGVALVTLYAAHLVVVTYPEVSGFQRRAQLWDQRDAAVLSAIAEGEKRVSVNVIDTYGIGVRDILRSSDMNGDWVNNCGSQYYGLDALRAVQH